MFSKSAEQMSDSTAKVAVSDAHDSMLGQYLDTKPSVSAADKKGDLQSSTGTAAGVLPGLDLVDDSKCMGGAPDSKCGVASTSDATAWVKPNDNGSRPVKPEPGHAGQPADGQTAQAQGEKPHKINDNGLRPIKPELEVRHPIYKDVTGNGDMRVVEAGVGSKPVIPNPGMEVTDKKPGSFVKPGELGGKPASAEQARGEGKPGKQEFGVEATPVEVGEGKGKQTKVDTGKITLKEVTDKKEFLADGKKDVIASKDGGKKDPIDQAAIDAKIRAYKEAMAAEKNREIQALTPEQLAAMAAKKEQMRREAAAHHTARPAGHRGGSGGSHPSH